MSKIKELLKSPHIQIALATGTSIIIMAYFSKRVLTEPISYLQLAIPPFLATLYEAVLSRYKNSRICTTWYWIVAILATTALIVVLNLI